MLSRKQYHLRRLLKHVKDKTEKHLYLLPMHLGVDTLPSPPTRLCFCTVGLLIFCEEVDHPRRSSLHHTVGSVSPPLLSCVLRSEWRPRTSRCHVLVPVWLSLLTLEVVIFCAVVIATTH